VPSLKAALTACHGLSEDRALPYSGLVFLSLNRAAKAALEKLMASGQFEYQSDFALKHRGEGEAIGVAKGEAIGVAKGEAIGVAKGEAIGVAKGEAKAVIAFLEARQVPLGSEARERILACTDLSVLERWIRQAVTVAAVEELFRDA